MILPDAEAIFLALADVDPADRPRVIDERCAGNRDLRRRVEQLLATLDIPDDDFLDPAQIPTLDMNAVDGPLQPGTRLGDFLVLHAIGSGGMGVVYAAQQERPRRTVAIKVLRRGFRHPEILRRFEHEAETLGRLQHPGIAQVYTFFAGGDRATPAHLVMELVSGPPLTDYVRAAQLSTRDRVELVVKLVDAIQHAHERGVIHRDLKPANVLVDSAGQPKVLDFGIARATGTDIDRITVQTAHGQLMGTLSYMSPEQLRGRPADVDGRADVYALGVVLYRVLTDRLPFDLTGLPWPEAIQRVLTAAPPPMAIVASTLEQIVARAMAREVTDRYQSASDLKADLQAWLEGRRPEIAGPRASTNTRPAAPGIAPLTAVVAEQDLICIATDVGTLTATVASTGAHLWSANYGDVRALDGSRSGLVAVGCSDGTIALIDAASGQRRQLIRAHGGTVYALAFTEDARLLVSAGRDGAVQIWNTITGVLVSTPARRATGAAAVRVINTDRIAIAWDDGSVETVAVAVTGD